MGISRGGAGGGGVLGLTFCLRGVLPNAESELRTLCSNISKKLILKAKS